MNKSEHEIRITEDGSQTIYSSIFNQSFHNIKGAVTENKYVFFEKSGIIDSLSSESEIHILEIGFGTGLNLILLADYLHKIQNPPKVVYQTIEAYPLNPQLSTHLDFSKFVTFDLSQQLPIIFKTLDPGQNIYRPLLNVELRFFNGLFEDFESNDFNADFIFFDAFSPKANPDLWTEEVFRHLKEISNPDVVLTTYCAAVPARAAMASADWLVARVPGVLGKREMTVAALSPDKLGIYPRINEEHLAKRYTGGEFR